MSEVIITVHGTADPLEVDVSHVAVVGASGVNVLGVTYDYMAENDYNTLANTLLPVTEHRHVDWPEEPEPPTVPVLIDKSYSVLARLKDHAGYSESIDVGKAMIGVYAAMQELNRQVDIAKADLDIVMAHSTIKKATAKLRELGVDPVTEL